MADAPLEPEDGFSSSERRALDAWVAPAAPSGFADRVLARAQPDRRPRVLRAALAAAAVLVAVIAAGTWATRSPSSGASAVDTRSTLQLGRRAIAVAEPMASVRWNIESNGDATVTQDRGNIFYRVEPGGTFAVQTPAGTARVMGTCFRVEVVDMNASGLKGAAIGAALSALAVVTVYEGHVNVESGTQELSVAGGEAALLDGASVRRAQPGTSVLADALAPAALGMTGASPTKRDVANGVDVTPEARVAALQQETGALRDRVRQLEASLKEAKDKTNGNKAYDLSQDDLTKMANECELRWDYMGGDASHDPTVSDDDAKALGFTADQQHQLDAVLSTYNQQLVSQIRALYTEMTHDPSAGSMGAQSMVEEANDKTLPHDRQLAFQNLARERAGLQPPPADGAQSPAFERLYRLFQGSGDSLEQQMAKVVGPELAHAYRDAHGGFGSKHRSSHGCPKSAQ